MKKNLFLRAAAMLTVFAMFSLCTIPRTLSKFSESPAISGKSVRAGIFRVAVLKSSGPPETWVTVGETGTGGSLTIDLFQGDLMEAYLDGGGENIAASKDGDGKETVGPAGSAAHILTQPGLSSPADSTAIIAPGCGGKFKVTVQNFSEVDVVIALDVDLASLTNDPDIKIQWWNKALNSGAGAWQANFPGIAGALSVSGGVGGTGQMLKAKPATTIAPLNGRAEYEFKWRWTFERGNNPSTNGTWYWQEDPADTALGIPGTITYSLPITITATQID